MCIGVSPMSFGKSLPVSTTGSDGRASVAPNGVQLVRPNSAALAATTTTNHFRRTTNLLGALDRARHEPAMRLSTYVTRRTGARLARRDVRPVISENRVATTRVLDPD